MPRLVTPALSAILNDAFVRASTLELSLRDGRVFRWATLALRYAGHEFAGDWLVKVDGTEQSVSVAIDSATVRLHNADDRFSRLIVDAQRLFENADAVVGAAFANKGDYDRNGGAARWVWTEKFRGKVRLPEGGKPAGKLSVIPDRESAGLLVNETYSENCELIYKGAECGYAGALPTCDHTLKGANGCERHANAYRYPGAAGEPDSTPAAPGGSGDPGGGIGGDIIIGTCFPTGTQVAAPRGESGAIETFRAGDAVLCFDPATRRIVRGEVKEVHRHEGVSEFIDIHLAGRESVRVTPEHPFFLLDGRFVAARDIQAGDWIGHLGDDGAWGGAQVTHASRESAEAQTVYNLSVTPFPTYFADGAAVHNLKRGDGPGDIFVS